MTLDTATAWTWNGAAWVIAIEPASASLSGIVVTDDQTLPGNKTIGGNLVVTNLIYDVFGDVSLDSNARLFINSMGAVSVDYNNGNLHDNAGGVALQWFNYTLQDGLGNTTVDWLDMLLLDTSGALAFDWLNRGLYDQSANLAIDLQNRALTDGSATGQLAWDGSGLTISNRIANYNSDMTSGNGVPAIVGAAIDLTGQTSSIGTSGIYFPGVIGMYDISVYTTVTTAGSAGLVSVALLWNDAVASRTLTVVSALSMTSTNFAQVSTVIQADSSASIRFNTTVSGAVGSPEYRLAIIVKRLS